MRIISSLITILFAGALAAEPMGLDHFTLDDGRVLTVEQLSFSGTVLGWRNLVGRRADRTVRCR